MKSYQNPVFVNIKKNYPFEKIRPISQKPTKNKNNHNQATTINKKDHHYKRKKPKIPNLGVDAGEFRTARMPFPEQIETVDLKLRSCPILTPKIESTCEDLKSFRVEQTPGEASTSFSSIFFFLSI